MSFLVDGTPMPVSEYVAVRYQWIVLHRLPVISLVVMDVVRWLPAPVVCASCMRGPFAPVVCASYLEGLQSYVILSSGAASVLAYH